MVAALISIFFIVGPFSYAETADPNALVLSKCLVSKAEFDSQFPQGLKHGLTQGKKLQPEGEKFVSELADVIFKKLNYNDYVSAIAAVYSRNFSAKTLKAGAQFCKDQEKGKEFLLNQNAAIDQADQIFYKTRVLPEAEKEKQKLSEIVNKYKR